MNLSLAGYLQALNILVVDSPWSCVEWQIPFCLALSSTLLTGTPTNPYVLRHTAWGGSHAQEAATLIGGCSWWKELCLFSVVPHLVLTLRS